MLSFKEISYWKWKVFYSVAKGHQQVHSVLGVELVFIEAGLELLESFILPGESLLLSLDVGGEL